MKDLFLRILREETRQVNELDASFHFNNRRTERFNDINEYDVIVNNNLNDIIGKFYVRDVDRDFIDERIHRVEQFSVPNDVTICVPLKRFKPTIDNITFIGNSSNERLANRQKFLNSSGTVSLVSPDNNMITGNYLVLFITKGKLRTMYLVKTINNWDLLKKMDRNQPGSKLAIVSKLNEFNEKVENAMTIKEYQQKYYNIRNPKPPETVEPSVPVDPTPDHVSLDKEKKKQHYLNSLKKR